MVSSGAIVLGFFGGPLTLLFVGLMLALGQMTIGIVTPGLTLGVAGAMGTILWGVILQPLLG